MNHFVDVRDIPVAELPEAERVLNAAIVKLSQQIGLDQAQQRVMDRLRDRLAEVRARLGLTASGRLLVSDESVSRRLDQKPASPPPLVADPSAVLDLGRDSQSGVALRILRND